MTVDAELVAAGNRAVRAGLADSLSGWVNDALVEREAKERRQQALAEAVAAYEAEHGAISAAEMTAQRRADDQRAKVLRGRVRPAVRAARRARAG